MTAPAPRFSCSSPASPRALVAAIGGVCILLGLAVLIGWHLHLLMLIQLRPTLAPMQYNTALCFVLAGIALGVWSWGRAWRAVPILGGVVAVVGWLTVMEYAFNADLHIDQLIFRGSVLPQASNIGRMSPVSACCFGLAGLALFLLGLRSAARWRPLAVGALASVIASIGLVAVFGYAFGLPGTYGWGQLTRVAAHTAAGLGLAGAGLFIAAWNIGCRPGERSPRWLPVPLALAVFTGSLVLYFALDKKQNEEIGQTLRANAESVRNQIEVRMDSRNHAFLRMAKRWEFSGAPSQASWEDDAANYVHDFPDLQALEWIDSTHRTRWIVPLAGNEAKVNLDLTQEDRRKAAIEKAQQGHRPVLTHIVTLFRGGLGFIVYVPIVVHGQSDGFIAAIFNAQTCLRRFFPSAVAAGEAIEISEDGKVFFKRGADGPAPRGDWIAHEKIVLQDNTWDLRMWPAPDLASDLDSPLPGVVLCAGAIGGLLLGGICFYAQRASRHAVETARANAALQAALDTVKTLEGLLPICSYCKRVRDDTGYWNQIDTYLSEHTDASLSHGFCPECAAKAFKEFGFDVPDEVQTAIEAQNSR